MKKLIAGALVPVMAAGMVLSGSAQEETVSLQYAQVLGVAHGTECFTVASVVLADGVIAAAYLDDYQLLSSDFTSVPNEEGISAGIATDKVLGSKRVNAEAYSEVMKNAADATMQINENFDVVAASVVGKTAEELKDVDAVSGATLADAANYVGLLCEAAETAAENDPIEFTGDISGFVLQQAEAVAHGSDCFTLATVYTDGEQIALAYLDDFQFFSDDMTGVPNSDSGLGENYVEGKVLGTKRGNSAAYSAIMASAANATVPIDENFDKIQEYVSGKTIEELDGVDSVSGATLADTSAYIAAIVEAVKNPK